MIPLASFRAVILGRPPASLVDVCGTLEYLA